MDNKVKTMGKEVTVVKI